MADGDGAFIVYSPQARDPEPRRATGLLGSLRASFDASSDDDSEAQFGCELAVPSSEHSLASFDPEPEDTTGQGGDGEHPRTIEADMLARARLKNWGLQGYSVITTKYVFQAALLVVPEYLSAHWAAKIDNSIALDARSSDKGQGNKASNTAAPTEVRPGGFHVAVLGFGRVGEMVLRALLKSTDLVPDSFIVVTKSPPPSRAVVVEDTRIEATADMARVLDADLIVVCVPPTALSSVAAELRGKLGLSTILLSLVAAVPVPVLAQMFDTPNIIAPTLRFRKGWQDGETGRRGDGVEQAAIDTGSYIELCPVDHDDHDVAPSPFAEDVGYVKDVGNALENMCRSLRLGITGSADAKPGEPAWEVAASQAGQDVNTVLGADLNDALRADLQPEWRHRFSSVFRRIGSEAEVQAHSGLRRRQSLFSQVSPTKEWRPCPLDAQGVVLESA